MGKTNGLVFWGGGVAIINKPLEFFSGGFEWRSIATHNQDPTFKFISLLKIHLKLVAFFGGKDSTGQNAFRGVHKNS